HFKVIKVYSDEKKSVNSLFSFLIIMVDGILDCRHDSAVYSANMEQADKALYEAKNAGRNRVCSYQV
ncbi:hypothetical protein E4V51_14200, partial [Paenibacillus sp. 28ISP30-2]|nr:hypothetical protein [Paenibacillus sp. 28ISP30-2]